MDVNETLSELTSLPVTDRLRVVESLWDSIESDTPVSRSPEQRDEIKRRIEAREANPDELLTWNQVLDQLRPLLVLAIALIAVQSTGCGSQPAIGHSGIGVPWTVGAEDVLPGTDIDTPGIDCGTVSVEDFTSGSTNRVSVVIWSDLPSGAGGGSAGGYGRVDREKAIVVASHLAPDEREIRYRCETTDGAVASVSIEGARFDTSNGTLFLVSTQGDEPRVAQRQMDFELGELRELLQELNDARGVSGSIDARRGIAEEIKTFALDSGQISDFFVLTTQQDAVQ